MNNDLSKLTLEYLAAALEASLSARDDDLYRKIYVELRRRDAELTDIKRTMSLCGIGDYKTWKDAQDQAYQTVLNLSKIADGLRGALVIALNAMRYDTGDAISSAYDEIVTRLQTMGETDDTGSFIRGFPAADQER